MTAVEPAAPSSQILGSHAARGAKVLMLGQGVRIAVQLVSVVVLARLLDPSAYGLFALALAVVSFGEVFRDFGLSTAAIQAVSVSRDQQSNLFWLNLGIGILLTAACVIFAPLLGIASGHSQSTELLRLMAGTFILNGAASQYRADLNRALRFEALVVSDVGGPIVGVCLGVGAALAGWGVWSLAVQQIGGVLTTTVLAAVMAGWLPRMPNRRGDVRPMMSFGLGMVGTQLVGYFNNYVDTLTIGLRLGPAQLGVYDRAYQVLMKTVNQFRNPSMSVALPVLARLEPGTAEADRMLLRGQVALGYTIVPGAALAAGAASPVVALALGPQWTASVPVFAVLAVAGGLQTVGFVSAWVYVSRGLTSKLFLYSAISLALRAAFVLAGSHWGIVGVAIGYATAPAVGIPLGYALLGRWTPLPVRGLLMGAVRIIGCATLAGLVTLLTQRALADWPAALQLVACSGAALMVYVALAVVARPVRGDVFAVLTFSRAALGSRRQRPAHVPTSAA